ncbi:MAG: thiamine pyrophosphate-dependent enzyme [Bacteroidia bacterium]
MTDTVFSPIVYDRKDLSNEQLLDLYKAILLPRLIEDKMLILLRQSKISKWFSGIGQEAIAVGLTKALDNEDYILPLHRNLGVFTSRNMPLKKLFSQWQGKATGYSQGRERSFHFGSPQDRVIGMISHLGAMLPVADGLALASNLDGKQYIAVPFSGDGGTSEGDFHEALNVAAVWDLPVLFIIENNGYGLSTPSNEQFRAKQLADRAIGYGIEGHIIDGNNLLEVYHAVKEITAKMREDRKPVILECMTFRMRGHEEASGTKYVPKELFEQWEVKDPVKNYEKYLISIGLLTEEQAINIRKELKAFVNSEVEASFEEPELVPNLDKEINEVYAPLTSPLLAADSSVTQELRLVDALKEGLYQAMQAHDNLIIMGQDVAEYGGVFKITDGFINDFGKGRVRNTPICESAILGAALGLSLAGKKAVVEMQFADFVSCGINQIANNLAKNYYRWQHAADVVVRMPTGAGVGAGPFHSQSNESWFTHIAGLKVVFPATPEDAKGLLAASILDPNPVIFFEHKALYRSISGNVPQNYYHIPLGKARIAREGSDMTIITYGMGVHWALEIAEKMKEEADIEVVDLRTLLPWDKETVFASVKNAGKCLVLYEDTHTGAFGAEIAATISEECFQFLDAPVIRLGSLDTPVPFNITLEKQFLANARLEEKVRGLLEY